MDQGFRARGRVSMNILVTGTSGFVGSALVLRLSKNGHRVVPLQRTSATGSEAGPNWNPAVGQVRLEPAVDRSAKAVRFRRAAAAKAVIVFPRAEARRKMELWFREKNGLQFHESGTVGNGWSGRGLFSLHASSAGGSCHPCEKISQCAQGAAISESPTPSARSAKFPPPFQKCVRLRRRSGSGGSETAAPCPIVNPR